MLKLDKITAVIKRRKLPGALALDMAAFILATKNVSIALLTHVVPSYDTSSVWQDMNPPSDASTSTEAMTLGVSWTVQHRSLLTDNDRTKRDHYARHKHHNHAPFGNGHVHIGRNRNAPARRLGESNSIKFMTADETKRFTRSPRIMLFLSGQTKARNSQTVAVEQHDSLRV
jgi:hypothetical protein